MAEELGQKEEPEFHPRKHSSWTIIALIIIGVSVLLIWMLTCPGGSLRTFTGECQTPGQIEATEECTNDIGCYISIAYKYSDVKVCELITELDTTYDENGYYWYCRATTVYERQYCDNINDVEIKRQCLIWFGN